jgi:hypothetical protein
MGVMIAAAAMGAVGLAGGIMGGIQQANQEQAQYMYQRQETMKQNFLGQLEHDRQTEAMATANVNQRIKDEQIAKAALESRFNSSWKNMSVMRDKRIDVTQQARAARATLESQLTGKMSTNSGTSKLLMAQASAAERRKLSQLNREEYQIQQNIMQEYTNALSQRDLGMSASQASAFIPGSEGIKPSKAGAITSGIFGGLQSGLGMASSTFALGS